MDVYPLQGKQLESGLRKLGFNMLNEVVFNQELDIEQTIAVFAKAKDAV